MRGSNVVCGVVNPEIWLKTFIKIYLHVSPNPKIKKNILTQTHLFCLKILGPRVVVYLLI